MKQLKLTQNKVALVDDDIYELVKDYNWFANEYQSNIWYARRNISKYDSSDGKRHSIQLQHVVMGKPPKGFDVDHIDGNGLNNQRSNLRIVTHRGNGQNLKIHRGGKLSGCTLRKELKSKPWQAKIQIDGITKSLGYFSTEQEAHERYLEAAGLK